MVLDSVAVAVQFSESERKEATSRREPGSTAMTTPVARKAKFCYSCGDVIESNALVCPRCGVAQPAMSGGGTSDKRILPAFLLCFLLGVFGAHRFYAGKIGTGLLELITFGGFGIWWLIDLILIVTGSFKDRDGQKITQWT